MSCRMKHLRWSEPKLVLCAIWAESTLLAKAVRAVPAPARWPLGEVPASHTGWLQLSPSPALNNRHCSRTPFSSPIFVPSAPPGEGIKSTLNNMAHIAVVGFESLNYYNTLSHALKFSCCLIISELPSWGTHLHIAVKELKALLLLRHDNTGLLWRICITQNTVSAVPYS